MPAPDPVTLALGRRVYALRRSGNLTQEQLGERMAELGCDRWSRTSVQKLESGKRGAVSVQEMLALALILGVPPVLLIADPREGGQVPVARGIAPDAWDAFTWVAGATGLEGYRRPEEGAFTAQALHVAHAIWQISAMEEGRRRYAEMVGAEFDAREAKAVEVLAAELRKLADMGVTTSPLLPEDVTVAVRRAGVELPRLDG